MGNEKEMPAPLAKLPMKVNARVSHLQRARRLTAAPFCEHFPNLS